MLCVLYTLFILFTYVDKNGVGRTKLSYERLSRDGKRKRNAELTKSIGREQLVDCTKTILRKGGNINGWKLMDSINDKDEANQIMKELNHAVKQPRSLTVEEAIAVIIEANLTKHGYKTLRRFALDTNHNLYPDYKLVLICSFNFFFVLDYIVYTHVTFIIYSLHNILITCIH